MNRSIPLLVLSVFVVVSAAASVHSDPFIQAMLSAEHERNQIEQQSNYAITFQNQTYICFDFEVGCFSWNETGHSGNLPEDPGMGGINSTFQLYNRGPNDDRPTVMFHEDENSYNNIAAFRDTEKPLFVVAHGFGGSGRTNWVVHLKTALLQAIDANVLAVDWRRGSSLPLYNQAVANTMSVGRATGRFLKEITRIYGYSPKRIHYVGFSMGAQVGGFAGRHYLKLTGHKFGRMTILDAAAPGFEKYGVHVQKEDSDYTVAVHTSAGQSIVTGKVGMVIPLGHIDFYPNGGISQPGCRFYEVKCHHERAHHYFREAVLNSMNPNACQFTARHCEEEWKEMSKDKCTIRGEEVGVMSLEPVGSDLMYLKTNYTTPFCLNETPEPETTEKNSFKWL